MTIISILGTVGIPANYGGFETLAENLVKYHYVQDLNCDLLVFCASKSYPTRVDRYLSAELRYINLDSNGISSIFYDLVSLAYAVSKRSNIIVLLGVSGAIGLPFLRLFSRAKIITNIDGIEWKREKWRGLAKWFLRLSEKLAIRFSHEVIADNGGIARHVRESYGRDCHVIPYGGDHALSSEPARWTGVKLPGRYALALCRIEPENNVEMILEAFSGQTDLPLVFIGNWDKNGFGRELKARYANTSNIYLLDPVYDVEVLHTLRENAALYVHGHSAGGTNPSLVEAMHFGLPVLAYDCEFNRYTTEEKALFFADAVSLRRVMQTLTAYRAKLLGEDMKQIAQERYTWDAVAADYFRLAGVLGTRATKSSQSTV